MVAIDRQICPRCESKLRPGRFEYECWFCGYADYTGPSHMLPEKKTLFNSANLVAVYCGPSPALKGKLLYYRPTNAHQVAKELLAVTCPYCEGETIRHFGHAEPYWRCDFGHLVYLVNQHDEILTTGWY